MGPEFEDINWRQYDPRQYDPRRIVREALLDDVARSSREQPATRRLQRLQALRPAPRPTPYDLDAT